MFKGIPYFCVLFLWNVHPLYLLQDKLRILGGGSTTNHLPSCLGGAVGITNGHNHADQLHHLGYQMILNPIITTTSPLVLELHPQVILFVFFWCVRLLFFFFFSQVCPDTWLYHKICHHYTILRSMFRSSAYDKFLTLMTSIFFSKHPELPAICGCQSKKSPMYNPSSLAVVQKKTQIGANTYLVG